MAITSSSSFQCKISCPGLNAYYDPSGIMQVNVDIEPIGKPARHEPLFTLSVKAHPISGLELAGLLSVKAEITRRKDGWHKETFGSLVLTSDSSLFNRSASGYEWEDWGKWVWRLTADDVRRLDALATQESSRGAPSLNVAVEVEALTAFSAPADPDRRHVGRIAGTGSLRISGSDWSNIAATTELVPVSVNLPTRLLAEDPYWAETCAALKEARDLLHTGEGADALHRCYDVLARLMEQRVTKATLRIYTHKDWQAFFSQSEVVPAPASANGGSDLPPSRLKALVDLFHGIGQLSNIMGHHAGQTSPADRQPMEQWEAELFVTMEHLAIGYLAHYLDTKQV